ncbi:MAG: hypothetical protein AB7F76_11585 [Parvibaculaceae bacterium]
MNDPERELVDDQATIAYRDDYGVISVREHDALGAADGIRLV